MVYFRAYQQIGKKVAIRQLLTDVLLSPTLICPHYFSEWASFFEFHLCVLDFSLKILIQLLLTSY